MTSGCIAPRCVDARAPGSLFCDTHNASPSGQRGGWLSAYKRRRTMGASTDTPLDASNIAKRLWIGAAPPLDRDLPEFDVLVLCAAEIQPSRVGFTKKIIRCGVPDGELTRAELQRILAAARDVAQALAAGKRVLVTCAMGLNRSALVTGLALEMCVELTSHQIIALIRQKRNPQALFNEHFVMILHKFGEQIRRARNLR